MYVNLTELDAYVINKYLNGYNGAIQFMRAVNRVTFGHNKCYLRAKKIEAIAGISSRVRIEAQKRLKKIGYIRVKERFECGVRMPNLIQRMPISKTILQEFANDNFVPNCNNEWIMRQPDGSTAPGWHHTMIADDVPDVIMGQPTEVDMGYLNNRKAPEPHLPNRDIREVFGSDDYVDCSDKERQKRNKDEGGSPRDRDHGPHESVGEIYQYNKPKGSSSSSGQAFVTTTSREAGSGAAAPRHGSDLVGSARQSRASGEDECVGDSGMDSNKSSSNKNPKNSKRIYTAKTPEDHPNSPAKKQPVTEVTYDFEKKETYLLSTIQDREKRHQEYLRMRDDPDFKQFRDVLALQCYIYEQAKKHDIDVRQIKPLPAFGGKLSRMKAQITTLGGLDGAKVYFDWIIENGGGNWLHREGWKDFSIYAMYANSVLSEYDRYNDGVDISVTRADAEKKRVLDRAEWSSHSKDLPDGAELL